MRLVDLGDGCDRARVQDVLFNDLVGGVDFDQRHVIAPEIGKVLQHAPGIRLVELRSLDHGMAQHQPAIAGQIDIDDLDIGVDEADVILLGQFAADAAENRDRRGWRRP